MFLPQTADKRMQVKGENPNRILIAIRDLDSLLEKLHGQYAASVVHQQRLGRKKSAPKERLKAIHSRLEWLRSWTARLAEVLII